MIQPAISTPLAVSLVASPVGALRLVATTTALVAVGFSDERAAPRSVRHPVLQQAERELSEYFAGKRRRFDVPLSPRGTPFQTQVWRALRAIPYGETTSYSALARDVGRPGAARAVGTANGSNPLAIIVPCHRVIAADGTLAGYAGGLRPKRWLLEHEARVVGSAP